MRTVRLVPLLVLVGAGFLAVSSPAAVVRAKGLHGFLFTASERHAATFHRTPSFAWSPVRGASRYELQLSTSTTFRDNGILYDDSTLLTPVAAPRLTLPWITGSPHSLYARVRALFGGGRESAWSEPYGFDVVPPSPPKPLPGRPGVLRWTTVDGADRYQIWLVDAGKIETVNTNVLDEREFYSFHNSPAWTRTVRWRVRALRLDVVGRLNGLPAAKYGAWSPIYTSTNPSLGNGPIRLVGTISDVFSNGARSSRAHELMPAFVWKGDETLTGKVAPLFRVYVFTDRECLNRVYTSAVVGSPSYAPRLGGPLRLPASVKAVNRASGRFLHDGVEPRSVMFDGERVIPNEQRPSAAPTTSLSGGSGGGITIKGSLGAPVDLWDVSWPQSGYYWTVIPVAPVAVDKKVVYTDLELPQDACAAGRIQRFGVASEPSLTAKQGPFASGLSAKGRLVSAAQTRKFYGEPLVAWTPAYGATAYEVQWSKKQYPFTPGTDPRTGQKGFLTLSTSAVLPLRPGKWWYRVRGYDYNLPSGAQEMAWSQPTRLVVTAPKFRVAQGHHRH